MIIFISLGIIASIFQLVILRELSFSLAKNELAYVIGAGLWIFLCSLGSIAKTPKKLWELPLCILASLAFIFSICLIHLSKSLIGLKYYEATSLGLSLFLSIILIAPPALVIGLAFKYFTQKYNQENPLQNNTYAKFFAFEAIGFFLGGVTFTFCLAEYTNPLIFSLLSLTLLPSIKNYRKKILAACLVIGITIISATSFNSILKQEFAGADILANLGSAYGPVIAARSAGATTVFSAGSSLASSEDRLANEEFIHMSLSATDPIVKKDVLYLGAPISGQIEEIAKYGLNSLDCLQINPLISKLIKNALPNSPNNKINVITDDPRAYLKNINKQYDAILMSMPAPINLALNRYFTQDFFKIIAKRLKPKGIFSFTIPSKREILSPQFAKFNSSIINAIDGIFPNKLIIPSDSMIVIASVRQKIDPSVLLDNFAKLNPSTRFFTIYHFKDYLSPLMRAYTQKMLDRKIEANTDFNPSGFLNFFALEQIKFYPDFKLDLKKVRLELLAFILTFIALIIITAGLWKEASCLFNIGTIGFTSISLTSIIFVLFQLYCGALFWKSGLLIAMFMAGLAGGAFLMNTAKAYYSKMLSVIFLSWTIVIFILFLNLGLIERSARAEFIFYLYFLISGVLTGGAYPALARNLRENKFDPKKITLIIYSTDLIGAFLGTLACGILLIPFLGIPYSLLILAFLNAFFSLKALYN